MGGAWTIREEGAERERGEGGGEDEEKIAIAQRQLSLRWTESQLRSTTTAGIKQQTGKAKVAGERVEEKKKKKKRNKETKVGREVQKK